MRAPARPTITTDNKTNRARRMQSLPGASVSRANAGIVSRPGSVQRNPYDQKSAAAGRKPNSVSAFARARPRGRTELRWMTTIPLGPALLTGSSDLPGGFGRAVLFDCKLVFTARVSASLFGLAPCGVLPAICLATDAVRSYRTFSPLLAPPFLASARQALRPPLAVYFLCHCPSSCPDRELPGALPCGVRTFLPPPPHPCGRVGETAVIWPAAADLDR